jgi:hypothetical protein
METQRFMGSGQLVNRLTAQLDGNKDFAIALLKKRGDMNPDGSLTAEGLDADAMTAEQRATDRASKKSGKPKSLYTYDSKTNRSTLK